MTPTIALEIPLERSRYWKSDQDRDRGHYDGAFILATGGGRFRHKIGYVSPAGEARQVGGGPLVPGPWAYTFCLSSVIDNHGGTGAERARNIAAGIEHDVVDGTELVIDGHTFVVRYARGFEHLRLELVERVDIQNCTCVFSCADDPKTMCSLSGEFHVHPESGACPLHPEAPGDL